MHYQQINQQVQETNCILLTAKMDIRIVAVLVFLHHTFGVFLRVPPLLLVQRNGISARFFHAQLVPEAVVIIVLDVLVTLIGIFRQSSVVENKSFGTAHPFIRPRGPFP